MRITDFSIGWNQLNNAAKVQCEYKLGTKSSSAEKYIFLNLRIMNLKFLNFSSNENHSTQIYTWT